MNSFKTIILALMLMIFSVMELQAKEVSLEQLNQLSEKATQAFYVADYLTTLDKCQIGLEKARELDDKGYMSAFLNNIGMVYDKLGQYQTALDYFQQALKIVREIKDRYGEGYALNNIGMAYNQLAQYQTALNYFQQALKVRSQIKDRLGRGKVLSNIGNVYLNLGKYQTALDYYQQALIIDRENKNIHGEGINISHIGNVYLNLGQYQIALNYYQQALKIARQIKDKDLEGNNLANIGVVYNNLGQYQVALDYYQQALTIHREIHTKPGEGGDLTNIGVVYQNLAQYQTALVYFQQSLKIHLEIKDRFAEGNDLSNIGIVYQKLGQYQTALYYHKQALKISREIKNRQLKGDALTNIGIVYSILGQYQNALDYFQQALTIYQEIQSKHGKGVDLINIGIVYDQLGQYRTALDYFQQALTIQREIEDKQGEGDVLTNIGMIHEILGQYQIALNYLHQALKIKQKIRDRRGEGDDLGNIGVVYMDLAQYQTALDYFHQALKIKRKIQNRRGEGMDLNNTGIAYQNLEKYQKAKEAFQDSAKIFKIIGSQDLWRAQYGLAFTEAKFNQPELAIHHYESAIKNIEKLRAKISEKEHKISFIQGKLYVYDEFITLSHFLHLKHPKKNYDRKGIEIFERKQGRVFLEEIGKSGAWRFAGVPEEISRKDREFEQQIAAIRKNRTEALAQKKDAEPHHKQLERLLAEQQVFEKLLATDYPKYYALKYSKPTSLTVLQNEILQTGEMMLVYNVMEESTALWVIGKQQFQMLVLEISKTELNTKVDAFRQSPNTLIKAIKELPEWDIPDIAEENLPTLRQASYELYQLLVPEKVRILLKNARTLYIVPTGSLYGLPFGALETHDPKQHDTPHYLIQDYPIAYLSSASLLKIIRDTERKESDRYPFLAFADPEYPEKCPLKPDNVAKVIQVARTEAYLKLAGIGEEQCFTDKDELPETKKQAKAIAQLLKVSENSDSLQLHDKASRSNVFDFHNKERLDDYQYVLFAAHAVLPNEISHINQSAIVLSNPDTEGYLTMADVFGLQMNADLVVLSACNTGRGEEIKGEGVRGLTRAFMYAGTPAVSVSLWNVESLSAKDLSIGLFKYLQQGKSLAQALRQSKLDLMKNEDMEMYQHPYFWAPFVVFGDGS